MPVFLIANIEVHAGERFGNYQGPGSAALLQYGGKFLAGGAVPKSFESDWCLKRKAIMEFDCVDAASKIYNSPEYKAAHEHRLAAATFNIVPVGPEADVIGALK